MTIFRHVDRPKPDPRQGARFYAVEKEKAYLREANAIFKAFTTQWGVPRNFSFQPRTMLDLEEKLNQASRVGDYAMTIKIGREYVKRAQAYCDAWRKKLDPDFQLPGRTDAGPDDIKVSSTRIPKGAPEEPSDRLFPDDKGTGGFEW